MNRIFLIGRLTKDPDFRQGQEVNIARYSLAVSRRKPDEADFINCVAFGKGADFAKQYLTKGMKIAVSGRLQTGSYTKQDGTTAYTAEVVVEEHEFCEKKEAKAAENPAPQNEGFAPLPEVGLPWA